MLLYIHSVLKIENVFFFSARNCKVNIEENTKVGFIKQVKSVTIYNLKPN